VRFLTRWIFVHCLCAWNSSAASIDSKTWQVDKTFPNLSCVFCFVRFAKAPLEGSRLGLIDIKKRPVAPCYQNFFHRDVEQRECGMSFALIGKLLNSKLAVVYRVCEITWPIDRDCSRERWRRSSFFMRERVSLCRGHSSSISSADSLRSN